MSADQIVEKVIEIIRNDVQQGNSELKDVKKVYYGRLKTLAIDYPAVVVWLEEEVENDGVRADSTRILYKDLVGISILERSTDEDSGEKDALRKAARVEEVLRSNRTLDNLVADEPLPAISKKILPVDIHDFALTEVSMTVTYRRWIDA